MGLRITYSTARLTKTYDVTIQRYRNSHAKNEDSEIHILRCMDSNFCVKFQNALWNFTQNLESIHRKICVLRGVKIWRLMISSSYDILILSDSGRIRTGEINKIVYPLTVKFVSIGRIITNVVIPKLCYFICTYDSTMPGHSSCK